MGVLGRISFHWINALVKQARKGDIDEENLPLPERQSVDSSYEVFEKWWSAELEEHKAGRKPSVVRALRRSFGGELMVAGLFKFFWSVLVILGAFYFIRSILLYVDKEVTSPYDSDTAGFALMAAFFVDAWLLGLALQRMGDICMRVGIRARAALTTAVAKKAFMMASANAEMRAEIVQFVSTDINRVYLGIQQIHFLWTAPIEAIAIISLVASQVEGYVIPGAIILTSVVPLQMYFGWLTTRNKNNNAENVSQRVSLIQEVLPAIKTVKYYSWEKFFTRRMNTYRQNELKFQWRALWINTVNISIVFAIPPINAFTIFTAYEFGNRRLMADIAFPALSLFNIMRFPLVVLPKAIRTMSEMFASLKELQEYLLLPHDHHEAPTGTNVGIYMKEAELRYEESDFKMSIPELVVRPGEVCAVVGPVGSGKSSIINACLGHMETWNGTVEVGGTTGYVPQIAWLQNLTVRENIIFGNPYIQSKYDQVVEACALRMDFDILRQGDQSKAGLRGVNLSGGQRQRVNLARCTYVDPEVVLLDSPLSAVDYHTAHHLYDNCIRGLMKDKAVLLVTHQPEIVCKCHKVMVLNEGKVIYYGPTTPQALTEFVPGYSNIVADDTAIHAPAKLPVMTADDRGPKRRTSLQIQNAKAAVKAPTVDPEIVEREKRDAKTGYTVGMWRSMGRYFMDAGFWLGMVSIVWFLGAQGSRQASDITIRLWTGDGVGLYTDPVWSEPVSASLFYSGIYFVCTFMFWFLMLLRGLTYCRWTMLAANHYLRAYTLRVFNAPLAFFFNNPVGDLLNVFAQDQMVIDEAMPESVHYLGIYGLILVFTIFTVSAVINEFFAFGFALFAASFIMLWLYLPAATQLKRMVSHNSGDLVGLVTETLEGLPVIQAFHKQDYFIHECIRRSDKYHTSVFNSESLNLWLAFFCDFFGAVLVLGVSVFAVVMRETYGASTVGLAFSNTIQMLVFYTWVVRFLAETISYWQSVESAVGLATTTPLEDPDNLHDGAGTEKGSRQAVVTVAAAGKELTVTLNPDGGMKVKQTQNAQKPGMKKLTGKHSKMITPDEWPMKGTLEYENVWMRYRYDAGWALRGVTFSLKPQEKVGVVGRTGSGKSTLLLALYGMFPLGAGHITFDGVDTQALPPEKLRKALSIIPQEPLMFSGTVRDNLDPYGEHNDYEIWTALRKVGLKSYVTHLPGKLQAYLDGGDGSWSLGQKQLICLARAALSHSPVLCLDEATAALDPETESHVLGIIAELFADRTILTIAHRLDTIIGSDTVMVLDKGELKEMDRPDLLLDDKSSMFSSLVDKLGPSMAAGLRQQAKHHAAQMGAIERDGSGSSKILATRS